MALMTQRAYARHRAARGLPGKTHKSVQKKIASGQIEQDASGLIDSEAADRAWAENSDEGHRRNPKQERPSSAPEPAAPPERSTGLTLAQATTIEKAYKAKLAKLDYEERSGKLINAADVEARWAELVSQSRTRLLGIPTRAKQQDPDLSIAQLAMLEALIREALEDLAGVE